MTTLHRHRKINQGVHIFGEGISLDIIVRDILGQYPNRDVIAEVKSEVVSRTHFLYPKKKIELEYGICFAISDHSSRENHGRRIDMVYFVPKRYKIELKDY